MINTILFDLDGTLLPMYQDEFIDKYFSALTTKLYEVKKCDPKQLMSYVWEGTRAMVSNNGEKTNRERFFHTFNKNSGWDAKEYEPVFDAFYEREFNTVKEVLREKRDHNDTIRNLKERGYNVVLATAPIFPKVAVNTRLSWIGLSTDDFDYVTSYENSTYCKPKTSYYAEILENIDEKPENCIMIGNNVKEDMSAAEIGIRTYLVTDYIENPENISYDHYENGSVDDMKSFLTQL